MTKLFFGPKGLRVNRRMVYYECRMRKGIYLLLYSIVHSFISIPPIENFGLWTCIDVSWKACVIHLHKNAWKRLLIVYCKWWESYKRQYGDTNLGQYVSWYLGQVFTIVLGPWCEPHSYQDSTGCLNIIVYTRAVQTTMFVRKNKI